MKLRELLTVTARHTQAVIAVYSAAVDAANHRSNARVYATNEPADAPFIEKHLDANVVEFEPCVYANKIRVYCWE